MIEVIRALERESDKIDRMGRWAEICKYAGIFCTASLVISSFILGASLKDNGGYNIALFVLWVGIVSEFWISWTRRRLAAVAGEFHQFIRTGMRESADSDESELPPPRRGHIFLNRRAVPMGIDVETENGRVSGVRRPNEEIHVPVQEEKKPAITRFMRKLRIPK